MQVLVDNLRKVECSDEFIETQLSNWYDGADDAHIPQVTSTKLLPSDEIELLDWLAGNRRQRSPRSGCVLTRQLPIWHSVLLFFQNAARL